MAPTTIAIVGGGPCGLTLARLLETKGVTDYVIYEREEEPSESGLAAHRAGGSLDLHVHTGQRALREAGLFDQFKKYARWDDSALSIWDKEGNKLFEDLGEERDRPEIDRGDLRRILLESVPKEKIRWGHALKSATLGEDGSPVLEFTNGQKLSGFRLVVGTDGAWSKVRPLVTDARPSYYGMHYIESKIHPGNPAYAAVSSKVKNGMLMALGSGSGSSSGKAILIQRQGDGHYGLYLVVEVPENFARGVVDLSDLEATRALFLSPEFYAGWAEDFKEFIRHSTDYYSWPLYQHNQYLSLKEDRAVSCGSVPGVVLAGDAAHTSTPFAGQGVNCAMTDALELSNKIAASKDLDQAVRSYEEGMFKRGVVFITKSVLNGELLFHKDGPEALLRALKDGLF